MRALRAAQEAELEFVKYVDGVCCVWGTETRSRRLRGHTLDQPAEVI